MANRLVSTIYFSSGKTLTDKGNLIRFMRNEAYKGIEDREYPLVFIASEDGDSAVCVNLKAIDYIEVKKIEE